MSRYAVSAITGLFSSMIQDKLDQERVRNVRDPNYKQLWLWPMGFVKVCKLTNSKTYLVLRSNTQYCFFLLLFLDITKPFYQYIYWKLLFSIKISDLN